MFVQAHPAECLLRLEVAAEPKMETSGGMRSVRDNKQTPRARALCGGSVDPCGPSQTGNETRQADKRSQTFKKALASRR